MLIEVFSNVHPSVLYSWRLPILHVCRYWRSLVLKTPQFWANLLTLRKWHAPKFNWRIGRFTAALALSSPVDLTLSLPFGSLYEVVNIMASHANRLAFLKITSICGTRRLLEQYMPRLRDLVIIDRSSWGPYLTLYFQRYPTIGALRLGLTIFYSLTVPCTSLHHLELSRCAMHALEARTSRGYSSLPSMRSVHDALDYFPNVETLILIRALFERHGYGSRDHPELTGTVHLPRLRRLKIAEDGPIFVQRFLSHLAFPSTTSLVLELNPRFGISYADLVPSPVFPSTNPSASGAPDDDSNLSTSISLFLGLLSSEVLPLHWRMYNEGTRPVHITLNAAARDLDTTTRFIHELVRALAPARGVTALTAQGPVQRSPDNIRFHDSVREYWATFLPDLDAELRRLVCMTGETTKDFLRLLGKPLVRSGEFPCARLKDLVLVWALPREACVELQLEDSDGGEQSEACGDAEELREGAASQDAEEGAEYHQTLDTEVAASLRELCDALRACLAERAGLCEPIQRLSVALRRSHRWYAYFKMLDWQVALVERQLQDALRHLVGEVAVVDEVD